MLKNESIANVKELNAKRGDFFFSKDSIKFWNTKIHSTQTNRQGMFITSEDDFSREKKLFTIRFSRKDGKIVTIGKFQKYNTLSEAKTELTKISKILDTMGNREKYILNNLVNTSVIDEDNNENTDIIKFYAYNEDQELKSFDISISRMRITN